MIHSPQLIVEPLTKSQKRFTCQACGWHGNYATIREARTAHGQKADTATTNNALVILSVADLMARWQCTKYVIYGLIEEGKLRNHITSRGRKYFFLAEIEAHETGRELPEVPNLYTHTEAIERLGIGAQSYRKYITNGQLNPIRVGGDHLYTKQMLASFRRRPPGAPRRNRAEDRYIKTTATGRLIVHNPMTKDVDPRITGNRDPVLIIPATSYPEPGKEAYYRLKARNAVRKIRRIAAVRDSSQWEKTIPDPNQPQEWIVKMEGLFDDRKGVFPVANQAEARAKMAEILADDGLTAWIEVNGKEID